MWSQGKASFFDNQYYVDTDRKAIISNQYTNRFHERKYFTTTFKSIRPDLTPEELKHFTNSFILSERLKVSLGKFYMNELDSIGALKSQANEDLALPIIDELSKIRLFKTFYNSYNPGFTWQDYTKSVDWVERIVSKVQKYGLQYPVVKLGSVNESAAEQIEAVRKEQNRVKGILLQEMGIDFSVLG